MFTETQQIAYFKSALEALFVGSKIEVECGATWETFIATIDGRSYTSEIDIEDTWFGFALTGTTEPVFAIPAAAFWGE